MKNVVLTNRSSERRADDIDFQAPSLYGGFKIQMKLDHISLFNTFLMYTFELIWLCLAIPDQAYEICNSLTKKSFSYYMKQIYIISKYYEHGSLQNFLLLFMYLLTPLIVKKQSYFGWNLLSISKRMP